MNSHILKGLGSAPFDAEGVATVAHDFIKDGILQQYVLSSYSARKLGMKATGNAGGVFNLFIQPTTGDLPALLKQMDKGLLVTRLMGQGVNIVAGDYSRGAEGFWVEAGKIQYPVEEITIAGNLKDMFMHLLAAGNDVDHRGNICSGSILIENMTVAGE
jgi:PmbA protein